jgi:hypothetical protein
MLIVEIICGDEFQVQMLQCNDHVQSDTIYQLVVIGKIFMLRGLISIFEEMDVKIDH